MAIRQNHRHHLSDARSGCADRRRRRALRQLSSRRNKKASTALSKAALASIIAQCPQLGNTCNSALGMVRIGMIAMSSGLTLSSRPHVNRVGAATLCITAHGIGRSVALIAAIIAAYAVLPYIRRAEAKVSGSVANCQRSSI